jgi:hypothetical protein
VKVVRSLQEIPKNLSGNLKIEIPSCEQILVSPICSQDRRSYQRAKIAILIINFKFQKWQWLKNFHATCPVNLRTMVLKQSGLMSWINGGKKPDPHPLAVESVDIVVKEDDLPVVERTLSTLIRSWGQLVILNIEPTGDYIVIKSSVGDE